jgi:cyclic beta-1,2-glucan synthetase
VRPSLPSEWDGFAAEVERGDGKYRISVSKASNASGYTLSINGSEIADPEEGYPLG